MYGRRSGKKILNLTIMATLSLLVMTGIAWATEGEAKPDFGILSLLPPLIAIGLCIFTKEVIPSLFIGAWFAGTMVAGWNPILGFGKAVGLVADNLGDPWGARIVLTSLVMGGLVGIMQIGGGIEAIVRWITKKIQSVRGAMLVTELAGFIIFFEDYVNSLVVGTTMSPITDRYRISKEKLSYIVDSTSAPIACIAGISSWVAYMVGQIGTQFNALEIGYSPYLAYLRSIPYVFYNIIALVLLTFVIFSQRDMGPMLHAERRARQTGKVLREGAKPLIVTSHANFEPSEETPRRVINFLVPLGFMVGLIFLMLVVTGGWPSVSLATAIGEGDSSQALVLGSFGSVFLTLVFFRAQKLATWNRLFAGFMQGMNSIFFGTLILIFAWAIGAAIKEVGTAQYIVRIAGNVLSPAWIPLLTFFTGAIISFCTGTSYGTMGVLMPIVIPLVYNVTAVHDAGFIEILLPTIGAVFAGAVWGDHCSPISDTTIMSSMFSGADHVDHVNSQMPYAFVAAAGAVAGYVFIGFGLPVLFSLILGAITTCLLFYFVSQPIEVRA
ncbi:Na+/H+ antiporter NhaC family protein [Aminobacterium sp. EBM-42]|uniref:Na+/H+ antiporter NhaC family protein n=1 Tax=Aminobacterium sp. EBM-42 TaxID=1918503 RepID=UPI00257C06C2|nr:Na+/H+ antiporter NhaC family protein [Aminobacterium sp. EBM-42]MDD3767394.1 Na+/H+ antiporter NhaC family protein [Aminobacterium colombiense]MDD4586105.1 Na+/H+ antiporter NhaC family protein [Aminobacterium colombiense]